MSRDTTSSTAPAPHSNTFDEEARRPARTSVILGVSIAVSAVAGIVGASRLPAPAVAALAGLSTGGVLLFVTARQYRIPKRLCASVLLFVCGVVLLGCVGLAFQSVRGSISAIQNPVALLQQPNTVGYLLLVAGAGIALGGASVTGRGSIRLGEFKSTIGFGLLTISLPVLGLGVLATVELADLARYSDGIVATTGDILLGGPGDGSVDYLGLAVTWGLLLVSITSVRLGLRHLPIAALAPSPRRADVTTYLRRIQSALHKLRYLTFATPVVVLFVEAVRTNNAVGLTDSYLRLLSMYGTTSGLRSVLLAGIAFGVVAVTLERSTKRLTRLDARRTVLRLVPVGTGLLLVIVAVHLGSAVVERALSGPLAAYRPVVQPLLSQYTPATLVVAALVIIGGSPIALYFVLLTVDYALLPEQTDGAALLSVGLFVAAVGSLLHGGSPLLGFVGIAGSFIAWDLTTNAVSLGREVGRYAPTRQAELVHTGGSLVVAVSGVVVAMIGLVLARRVSSPPESAAPIAAVISIAGLFALIFGLRGR